MRPADAVHHQSLPGSRTFPAVMTRTVVFGAVLWTLSIVFFLDQVVVQLASAKPYDLATNLISDLGNSACGPAICSPLHAFMNATFVVVGAFHWIGAASIRPALPRRRLSLAGAVLVALAGWGLIFAGLTPENVDGARHAFGAIVGLISLNLAMIVLGVCLLPARRWLGAITLGAGMLGCVGFALMMSSSVVPVGAAERVADYPGACMIVVLGVFLLVLAARDRRLWSS
jgi:hypothetical membrane protein